MRPLLYLGQTAPQHLFPLRAFPADMCSEVAYASTWRVLDWPPGSTLEAPLEDSSPCGVCAAFPRPSNDLSVSCVWRCRVTLPRPQATLCLCLHAHLKGGVSLSGSSVVSIHPALVSVFQKHESVLSTSHPPSFTAVSLCSLLSQEVGGITQVHMLLEVLHGVLLQILRLLPFLGPDSAVAALISLSLKTYI